MNSRRLFAVLTCGVFAAAAFSPLKGEQSARVSSPNNKVQVKIEIKKAPDPPNQERLFYSIVYSGREVVVDSPWALEFQDMPPLAENLRIVSQERRMESSEWETVWGKRRWVKESFREVKLLLEEAEDPNRQVEMRFRAYDDGVAFRYGFPEQNGIREFRLTGERSEFRFSGNHRIWVADYGGFESHQESEFEERNLGDLVREQPLGLPLLVQIEKEVWLALTEANLTDWAGMYLSLSKTREHTLVTVLSPRLDQPGVVVHSQAPRQSPWRVVLLGESPGRLMESDLVLNLNEPSALENTSWIVPGKSAWDRWWSGDYAPDADFKVGMNTSTMKYFTRFAAEMGWRYVLVDWHWYGDPLDAEADITTPAPELDMPELLRYASDQGVRLLLWLRWNHASEQMEKAFPLYEKWGIAGVKVDFMQRDDQEMVNFYHRLVKLAAKHHLVVDFHGSYKPTGIRRTYPNLLTREGVLGNEYNKWSRRVTPRHNVTLPFTRMLAGPMDFTPGGFRHRNERDFVVQDSAPYVMGTRAHQLAMMIVYESPLQVLCDSPFSYRNQSGLDFLKVVPTSWDETRFLAGDVGEFVSLARQAGREWFVGTMNGPVGRDFELFLDFLGQGKFAARIYEDAPGSPDHPEQLQERWEFVTSADQLPLRLIPGGGHVIHLIPVEE